MKKNGFLAIIAMAALSFAACNKEGLPQNDATDLPSDEPVVETPVVLEPGVYPATVVAEPIMPDLAGTKAVFDNGAFAWEAGDAIACFQYFELLNEAETNVITTMTTAAGDGNFAGSLPYTESETYQMNFIHPASVAIKLVGVEANQNQYEMLEINLPNEQDGRPGNLGNYFIAGKAKVPCVVSKDDPDNISITTENVILDKYPVFAVKVDVPEAYNAQSIKIEALRDGTALGLAGQSYLNVNNCQHKGPKTYPGTNYLTIRHNDDSQISGDTYGVMMPYAKNAQDPCTVNKIKFTVTTSSSQTYTFAKSVSELRRGTIYDLGTFPTSCVTPKFSFDENGAVVMTSSPAEAKIYYTTDGTEPSAESAPYEGPVSIVADTQFKAIAICEGLDNSAVAEYTVASGVTVPVLKINESGFLTVEAVGGNTYTYSMTSDGSIPVDPVTPLPEEGLNLCVTGSYNIKVKATNIKGETAVTNGYYRVYYISSALPKDTPKVELNASNPVNTATFAPFTATWFASSANEGQTCYLARGTNGNYWKTEASGPSDYTIYIGLETRYASDLSMHAFCRGTTNVYPRYCGIRGGTAEDGVVVPASIKNGIPLTDWSAWWSIKASAGKMIEFAVPNGRELRGWGVLEQGFEAFNPAAASVSNEAPVSGQNVAY